MALLTPLSSMPDFPGAAVRTVASPPPTAATVELRLAVVCDGGVSLAIYEHGVTKELQNVVRASRAFDAVCGGADPAHERAQLSGTQCAYFDALMARAETEPMTVVIDIVSGTSAGGINGVCLAKGLARNVSQDPLTEMWMQRADLSLLAHRKFSIGLRSALAETLLELPTHLADAKWSPLHGDLMAQWLVEALDKMDADPIVGGPGSLMPGQHELDLFVTATDLRGYVRIVPSPDGGAAEYDRVNRKVFHFSSLTGPAVFGPGDNPGLAFAARCTSSFPGAFAPANLQGFSEIVAAHSSNHLDVEAFIHDHLAEYDLAGESSATTFFADGGLLDNSPFDHVMTAIAAKSAQSRVQRRIVHIDPNPSGLPAVGAAGTPGPDDPTPSYLDGLRAALKVRSAQSIVADLLDMQSMNDTIGQVGRIVTALQQQVSDYLDTLMPTGQSQPPSWQQAQQWADQVHGKVAQVAGDWGMQAYTGMKLAAIAQMFGADLATALGYPDEVQQSAFLQSVMNSQLGGTAASADFLDAADMPYRERRMRFVIEAINNMYGTGPDAPSHESLNRLKGHAWSILNELIAFRRDAARALVADGLAAVLDPTSLGGAGDLVDPSTFAATHADQLQALVTAYTVNLKAYSKDSARKLWEQFITESSSWPEPVRHHILYRYLGFPLWDALTFPIIALSRLPQLTPVQLQRISTRDAHLLVPPAKDGKPAAKLRGTALHNFGGFLDEAWRQNDYLWGRLDAVELIMAMLGQHGWTAPVTGALTAVLDQEAGLKKVRDLIADLRTQLPRAATS